MRQILKGMSILRLVGIELPYVVLRTHKLVTWTIQWLCAINEWMNCSRLRQWIWTLRHRGKGLLPCEASHLKTWIRGHDIVCQPLPARQTSRSGSHNSQRWTFMCSCNMRLPSRGNNRGAMNARRVYRISHFMGTRYEGWCMSVTGRLGKVKTRAMQESCVPLGLPVTEEWCVCMPPTRKM